MIRMTMEAESFEQLVRNLCSMLDQVGALDVAEVQQQYKLTYSMMWRKMGEYDLEMGNLAAADLMQNEYNCMSLSELPLDVWHKYYDVLEKGLDDKRHDDQTQELIKELAW
jgi:hypothetical protein